jgi:hypothetical protein
MSKKGVFATNATNDFGDAFLPLFARYEAKKAAPKDGLSYYI